MSNKSLIENIIVGTTLMNVDYRKTVVSNRPCYSVSINGRVRGSTDDDRDAITFKD